MRKTIKMSMGKRRESRLPSKEERQRQVDEIVASFDAAYWRMKKNIREL